MKKVVTVMRTDCSVCGHKLTEDEADRKHCPYCKNVLITFTYPEKTYLRRRIKNDRRTQTMGV